MKHAASHPHAKGHLLQLDEMWRVVIKGMGWFNSTHHMKQRQKVTETKCDSVEKTATVYVICASSLSESICAFSGRRDL